MSIVSWFRRNFRSVAVITLLLLPVLFGLHWWYLPSIPSGAADQVAGIDLYLYREEYPLPGSENKQDELKLTIDNTVRIRELLESFRDARRASEHKCANSGRVSIRWKSGDTEELYILPGHDSRYYEYRFGTRINRIDRERFVTALKAAGVKQIKLSPP